MIRLNVELTEDLRRKAEARASESGHASLETYVEALVRADTEGEVEADLGAPSHLNITTTASLESLLLSRLEAGGPSVEATPEFWDALKARARGSQQADNR
jgi:hypothetical protein